MSHILLLLKVKLVVKSLWYTTCILLLSDLVGPILKCTQVEGSEIFFSYRRLLEQAEWGGSDRLGRKSEEARNGNKWTNQEKTKKYSTRFAAALIRM